MKRKCIVVTAGYTSIFYTVVVLMGCVTVRSTGNVKASKEPYNLPYHASKGVQGEKNSLNEVVCSFKKDPFGSNTS